MVADAVTCAVTMLRHNLWGGDVLLANGCLRIPNSAGRVPAPTSPGRRPPTSVPASCRCPPCLRSVCSAQRRDDAARGACGHLFRVSSLSATSTGNAWSQEGHTTPAPAPVGAREGVSFASFSSAKENAKFNSTYLDDWAVGRMARPTAVARRLPNSAASAQRFGSTLRVPARKPAPARGRPRTATLQHVDVESPSRARPDHGG